MAARILLVTRDQSLADDVRLALDPLVGCELRLLDEGNDLVRHVHSGPVALCIYHVSKTTAPEGVEALLRQSGEWGLPLPVVVISDEADPRLTLRLLRMGAVDCFSRPLDRARFGMLADMLTVRQRLHEQNTQRDSQPTLKELGRQARFLFGTREMQGLMDQVRQAASHDANVLLSGETGSGKTLLARVIHELSDRRDEPFLVVNCATLSESLVESELFGHCRGAFTGADRDRVGKLAAVGRGTLLLDDIDALSPVAQAKLLRAIEERVLEPVGSNRTETVVCRFIVASNRDLQQEVAAGRFRMDLFYRLNVVQFHLPPLRERRDEIPLIAEHFVGELSAWKASRLRPLSPHVLDALRRYDWPGNVRELRNVVERGVALCRGQTIEFHDLPPQIQEAALSQFDPSLDVAGTNRPVAATSQSAVSNGIHRNTSLAGPAKLSSLANARIQAEINRILQALDKHENNRKRAAEELGISRTALYKKLHRYGLMDTA